MTPTAWKQALGETAWNHIMKAKANGGPEEFLAEVLNRATEVGFQAPVRAPQINPEGTKLLWDTTDKNQKVPALTATGLLEHWEDRGHGWLLMKLPQLMRAVRGPMLPRFQELWIAYESQCEIEEVNPLPVISGQTPRYFAGGADSVSVAAMGQAIVNACPQPKPPKQKAHVGGPGQEPVIS